MLKFVIYFCCLILFLVILGCATQEPVSAEDEAWLSSPFDNKFPLLPGRTHRLTKEE